MGPPAKVAGLQPAWLRLSQRRDVSDLLGAQPETSPPLLGNTRSQDLGQESYMRHWTLIAAFIVGGPVMAASPASAQPQNWLLGTWKLVSATQIENSQAKEYLGAHPLGQVIFGADGQFSN